MRELSLNILDIVENSIKAKAKNVHVIVEAKDNVLTIQIKDDGCGMDKDFLAKVTDPFTTTRKTRSVGLGLPLLKMETEQSGGSFVIESEKNVGTTVTATFQIDHIDRPPLGNLPETVISMVTDLQSCEMVFEYIAFGEKFVFDTKQVKQELGEYVFEDAEVLLLLKQMIEENITTNHGGVSL